MIEPKVTVDASSAIRSFAALKNVNVYTVVFNAMKDFLAEAYRQTPVGKLDQNGSEWAVLSKKEFPRLKKDVQFVKIPDSGNQRYHLSKHRVKIARKWSMTSWIAAFKLMGMGKEARGESSYVNRHKAHNTLDMVNVVRNKLQRKQSDLESITVTDRIFFDKLPGTANAIIAAGEAKAAMNIAREWDRQLKKRWM